MSFQLKYKTCQNNDNAFPPVSDEKLQQISAAFRNVVANMKEAADQYLDEHIVEVVMVDLDKGNGEPVDKQVVQCRHQKP